MLSVRVDYWKILEEFFDTVDMHQVKCWIRSYFGLVCEEYAVVDSLAVVQFQQSSGCQLCGAGKS